MFIDLLVAACAALAAVGVALLAFRLLGRRAPRWVAPVAAAVGMVAVTAGLRYQWASHTESMLPQGMLVLERLTATSPFEPWSYVRPVTEALVVADRSGARRNPAHPEMVMLDVMLLRRGQGTLVARHLVDCGTRRDAVVPEGWEQQGGQPGDLTWATDGPPGLVDAACATAAVPG